MKPLRAVLVGAAAAVLAAGCINIDVNADLALSSDDTVSGNLDLLLSMDAEFIEEMENLGDDFDDDDGFDDDLAMDESPDDFMLGENDIDELDEEVRAEFDTVTVEYAGDLDDDAVPGGSRFVFNDTPLDEFNTFMDWMNEGDDFLVYMQIARDGDNHVVTGSIESSVPDDQFGMVEVNTSVALTFAGEVSDSNGVIDGNTVTWDDTGELSATGTAEGSANLTLVLFFVVALFLVGGAAAAVVAMSKKKDVDDGDDTPTPGDAVNVAPDGGPSPT